MEDEVEPEADTETLTLRIVAYKGQHYPRVDHVSDRPNRAPATRGSSKPCTTTEKITTPKQIVTM